MEKINSENLTMIIATTIIGVSLVTFMIIMLVYRIYKNNLILRLQKPLPRCDSFNESTSLRTGTYTVDHLKFQTILGELFWVQYLILVIKFLNIKFVFPARGRFGTVWQGSMGEQDVAVKIFSSHHHGYFQNEKDTYSLPFMEHSSLLHYYGNHFWKFKKKFCAMIEFLKISGSDERMTLDGNMEYLLVFSYAPGGTLRAFLQHHVVDWLTFCKMSLSVVKGLAYLHTDVRKGGETFSHK